MKKFILFGLVNLLICSLVGADQAAPRQLPRVAPEMLSAGYWVAQHPSPDRAVMQEAQIKAFNANIRAELKLTKDIFSLVNNLQMESLLETLKKNIVDYADKGYYLADGTQEDQVFVDRMKKNMHLSALVLGVMPRYGLIVSFANQRFFPTKEGLYAKRGDTDFDELQNSALDVGTAVAVVHTSLDGKWSYVLSALSDGWVESDKIALADAAVVRSYVEPKDFVVITAHKTDIFLDSTMTSVYHFARMGNKFPLLAVTDGQWVVQVPHKAKDGKIELIKGYIAKEAAHAGYLPYTPRVIYNQAFKLLDRPYGWGDMNGEQDCSRFLQMVYATVGLEFPRDSKNQAQVGAALAVFDDKAVNQEKTEHLQKAVGATTILQLKGHIMLYLGMVAGVPYAIHATSGYTQTIDEKQVKFVLNRVVVSDLSLGENSTRGSLLRRLIKIVGVMHDAN